MSTFRILQGGVVRYPLDATYSGSNATWSAGQICELDPTTLKVVNGSGAAVGTAQGGKRLCGLVIENQAQTIASGKVSLLLSAAVVQSDQLAAGITFTAGELVYMNSAGLLTNSASVAQIFGKAITNAVATNGDTLTFLYMPVLS